MAANSITHPSAEVLQAFALGKLNDTSASVVLNHLDSCPDCCQQVAALSGGEVAGLRGSRGHAGGEHQPVRAGGVGSSESTGNPWRSSESA